MVLKCLSLARIGRPDIFRTVDIRARAVADANRACDRRLARLISCTCDYRQYCPIGDQVDDGKLGFFQDASVVQDVQDSMSNVRDESDAFWW